MRRHEVLQYIKTITEVGFDRQLDCSTGCISHQTTHTSKLFDLFIRTTGSGIRHHEDVVVFIKTFQKHFCKLIIGLLPCLNNFFVTFFLCDKTTFVLFCNSVYCILSCFDHCRFLWWNRHIGNGYGHRCSCGIFVTHSFYSIQNFCCLGSTMDIDYFFKNLFVLFLGNKEIYFQF